MSTVSATASLSVTLTGAASGDVLAVRSSDESVVTVPASVDASTGSCSVTLTAVKTGTAAVTLSCGTGHTGAGRCDRQGDERPYRDL